MIREIAKAVAVQLVVTLICAAAVFLIGYFALDFTGAFERFPKEFALLVVACIVLIIREPFTVDY